MSSARCGCAGRTGRWCTRCPGAGRPRLTARRTARRSAHPGRDPGRGPGAARLAAAGTRAGESGGADRDPSGRLARIAAEFLLSAEASANLVVLRTPAGAAQFLASAVDHAAWSSILGPWPVTTRCWSSAASRTAAARSPTPCCASRSGGTSHAEPTRTQAGVARLPA